MLEKIRNIGIIAHVDAGKTTTTERILYFGHSKHVSGDVDDGNTTTDFDPLEKAKGITINSAAVSLTWKDCEITIIDTPGHVDFTAEVERSLRVLDGAIGVFCAVGGVEVQSETVWHQANKHRVPRVAFINKLDRTGADFYGCIEQMKKKLGILAAICAIPAGQSDKFEGVIDLIRMKLRVNDPKDPTRMTVHFHDIPAAYQAEAAHWREKLIDAVSHVDDKLMETYLEGKEITEDMLRSALRTGTLAMALTPVLCGSAKMYHGVQLVLDAICDYLPSPDDRPPVEGTAPKSKETVTLRADPREPLSALAFKTVSEKHGDLIFIRIYSGEIKPGDMIYNSTRGKQERVSHIYRLFGDRRDRLDRSGPGEIVAVVGFKNTATGNTLCLSDNQLVLEEIRFPEPVISQALIPPKSVNEAKLGDALAKMVRDDPTLKAMTDPETKQLIISGMGELHLEVAVHRLKEAVGSELEVGKPMVAYRQTLAKAVDLETRYIKQSGGRGKYAVIKMKFGPLSKEARAEFEAKAVEEGDKPDPNGIYFTDTIFGGSVPTEYIPSVAHGFREATRKGAKYGFPVVDVYADLYDGKYHEVDSSADTFRLAGVECFRDAQIKAGITVLEPIMNVVVHAPSEYLGDLIGDVTRRRGEIVHSGSEKNRCEIRAYVPLAELFGYTSELRNFTSGTAAFTMEPSHYAPVREDLIEVKAAS